MAQLLKCLLRKQEGAKVQCLAPVLRKGKSGVAEELVVMLALGRWRQGHPGGLLPSLSV